MIKKQLSNLFLFGLFIFAELSLVSPILGQSESEAPEVNQLLTRFEEELEALNSPEISLNEKYRGYLEKQKAVYQKAGNLEAMIAVEEELKNFEIALPNELSSFEELKRLQGIYREQQASLATQQLNLKLKLIQEYRKATSDLASAWTKAGRISAAKLALSASKRFEEMENDPALIQKAKPVTTTAKASDDNTSRKAGDELKNSLGMRLHWIPAGQFSMGLQEEAQVKVELSRGFWMGKYEVTQEEYEEIIGSNPGRNLKNGKRGPVENVTWDEALSFCAKLTDLFHENGTLDEDWLYTLPTEAQWEYACRAGSSEPYSGGNLDELGWYDENGENKTHETGKLKANAWGLHDMHGNVREWCLDSWSLKLKGGLDPVVMIETPLKVFRGGSWKDSASQCRSGHRYRGALDSKNGFHGFRIVLIQSQ